MRKAWWKEAVAYQIYPRSFMDFNGDGIGDIRGIIEKLDYLVYLGVDVIWVSPFYKSPNDDNGYDISDYKAIMDEFGTMEDFDELLKEAHKRNIKLIADLVINHTSDEHPWFIESKSSIDNDKRDWYIWRKGKNNKEPNNWESIFKGSAWQYEAETGEYYLHLFSKKQPDLNWENKEVREALYEMINWWLDKGIDGFRIDAISHIKKDQGLLDMPNPDNLEYVPSFDKHSNRPGIQNFLKELKINTFDKYDIMTVGEAAGVDADEAKVWVGEDDGKFNMIFQFENMDLWNDNPGKNVDWVEYKRVISKWQNKLHNKGWNALYIENHDTPRAVSTLGNDKEYIYESATSLALMYFMMEGTPFIYQGQELGMTNTKFNNIEEYNDVRAKSVYEDKIKSGRTIEEALRELNASSRDNTRTPMQWDSSKNGGFTVGNPWIKVNENYEDINVEKQLKDSNSVLNFYKNIIKVRKENECLIYGLYNLILKEDKNIFAYERILDDKKFLIITNLSNYDNTYSYNKLNLRFSNLVISNYEVKEHKDINSMILKPWEARMYKI
ncbi:alpha-glucosidase [Romboutsia ilealis]|uniref:Alpha-amylase n=1 Tax=Romboutsia faecis TaxID=2764597 RepID=A0ABR7JQX4_9FIRM|nr:alpha-glucosidase [Romboutsia faecis]MBC5997318.1 alpha-glucosidase [Romboutsia faecis]MRN23600.1 alpha-glucosidase [Romboutsia ilealis]